MVVSQISNAASQAVNLSANSGKENDDSLKFSQVLEKTKVDAKSDSAEKTTGQDKPCINDTENESNGKDIKDIKSKSDSKDTDVNNASDKQQSDNQQAVNPDGSTVIALNVQQILGVSQLTASTPTTDTVNLQGTVSINTDINVNLTAANSGLNINSISDVNINVVPNNAQQAQTTDQQQVAQQTNDQQNTGTQNAQQQTSTVEQQIPTQQQIPVQQQTAQTENNVSGDSASTVSDELNTVTVNELNGIEIKTQSTKKSDGGTVTTETQSPADLSQEESGIVSTVKDDKSDFTGTNSEEKPNSDSNQSNGNLGVSDGSPILAKTDNTGTVKTESSHPLSRMIFNQISDQVISNLKTGNTNFEFELHPQQLGKISVKMSIQDSILTVEISASSTKTQNILLANSDDIKSMLQTHLNHSNQVNDFTNVSQSNNWQDNKESNSSRHQTEQQQNNNEQDDEVKETSTADFLTIMQAVNANLIYKGGD